MHIYIYIYIYVCVCVCVCVRVCVCVFYLKQFVFVISPVRNLLLGLTPENFLKFEIFPGESSRPHRVTETGCTLQNNVDAT